jgi:hypothetical protein
MKKVIVIILWFILVSMDWSNPQKNSVSSEDENLVQRDVMLISFSVNTNIKNKHPFVGFCKEYQKVAIYYHIECGIPTSIQLAQAIAESGGGKSELAIKANNLFGMKYYESLYNGDYWESPSGTKWRKYDNFNRSFEDHADFLDKFYPHIIGKDWKFWVENCKGYGGKDYWVNIAYIIKKYELWKYDECVDNYKLNKKNL